MSTLNTDALITAVAVRTIPAIEAAAEEDEALAWEEDEERLRVVVVVVVVLVGSVVYTLGELTGGPVTAALEAEAAPDHLRGRYLSLIQLAWNISGAVAPVAFAWLLEGGATPLWCVLLGLALVGGGVSALLGRVLPLADELDSHKGEMPRWLIEQIGEQGWFGITIPEEDGGLGLGVFEYCLVSEELARAWMSVGSILARAVQFITQLKDNETQNIEKWTLEKLLTEQAIAELSSSCDKLKNECQRARAECEQWKKAAQKAGITSVEGAGPGAGANSGAGPGDAKEPAAAPAPNPNTVAAAVAATAANEDTE